MKTKQHIGIAILAGLTAAQVASAASSSFTATGWVIDVPVQGIRCTNALGQVGIRGNAHVARVECPSDARLTGRRLIFVDGAAQADGSSILYGTAYQEVGTWDETGTNFTATGGMWDTTYRGTRGADGSLQLHIVGTGCGGAIDGLRLDETIRRAPGPILDPALPYQHTGTLKPTPVNTSLVLDDFDGPAVGWGYYGPFDLPDSYSYTRNNGQLVVSGYWPGVITRQVVDSYTNGGLPTEGSAADGETLETRVDLVDLNASATAATLSRGNISGFYALYKGHDFMAVRKWSSTLPWGPVIVFSFEKVQLPDTNVILTLAVTKVNTDVVVTARVLDKSNPSRVLYERTVKDTPDADPALTSEELFSISGMDLALCPDFAGAPFTFGGASVGVFQYNYDGQQPEAVATFDNLELWKYEIPVLSIRPAVALTWPDAGSYSIECAPTPQGPYLPANYTVPPGMKQVTVPVDSPAQFFRLRQAP